MGKKQSHSFTTDNQLWNDLEQYQAFCVEYGYKFDESTLYDMRNNAYRQFNKQMSGKHARNCWVEDSK